jgi:acyl CoA:acetate/3-ketoacid CoA transferase beta subunit
LTRVGGTRIITDLAVFGVTANGLALVELAPGVGGGEALKQAGCCFRIT